MTAPGEQSKDSHPERPTTSPAGPYSSQHTRASSMLAASRMPQLPSPTGSERATVYAEAPRYGAGFPPSSDSTMSDKSSARLQLPSVSQLLNPAGGQQQQQQQQQQQPPPPFSSSRHHPPPSLPPPPLTAPASDAYIERPFTSERRHELPSGHLRTASEGQLRQPGAHFHETWRESNTHPMQHSETAGTMRHHPHQHQYIQHQFQNQQQQHFHHRHSGSVGTLSPGLAGGPLAHSAHAVPQAPDSWRHPSQSPQSTVSSVAPGTTSLATAQKEKPTVTRRLLGERNIPGEGRMYVYDDGTKIPTVVDGEPVNGQWGMTKAGRPRKRMPQACIPCRQKKIKCDPGDGKCSQCEKSGKDCSYSHGHRGQKNSPTSPRTTGPATPSTLDERPTSSPNLMAARVSSDLKRKRSLSVEAQSLHKRIASSDEAPWSEGPTTSRRAVPGSPWARGTAELHSEPESLAVSPGWQPPTQPKPVVSEHLVGYGCWASGVSPQGFVLEDPFVTEPEKAATYLQTFFERINNGTYCTFPRTSFIGWARSGRRKSRDELMTLYALLADGALFARDRPSEAKQDSERYLRLARTAIETTPNRQGLMMVLARMIVGHTYVVQADFPRLIEINDVSRTVSLLKYDMADRLRHPDPDGYYDFGMNRHGLEELYRRTQWIAFLMDRFVAMNLDHPLCMRKEDIFLPLPCDEDDYDRQRPTRTPYFDNGVIARSYVTPTSEHSGQSPWSYFLQSVSFASDIWTAASRSEWQDENEYPGNCDGFGRQTAYELDVWFESLPHGFFLAEDETIDACIRDRTLGLYVAVNALYHVGHMSLNRRVRHLLLPGSSTQPRVHAALDHAERFLRKLKIVRAKLADVRRSASDVEPWITPVPFVRYAILVAVDIITACGNTRDMESCNRVVDLCDAGVASMEELVTFYANSRPQLTRMAARMAELRALLFPGHTGPNNEVKAWVCRHPLDPQPLRNMDLFYKDEGGITDVVLNVKEVDYRTMRVTEIQRENRAMESIWG